MDNKRIKSPCVRNCCLDESDICIGCGRSLYEITHWTQFSAQQQREIVAKCRQHCRFSPYKR
ncbi:DUF1289 domain-containing protein [Algibacillus agarilyticus]|uniref:DUF1289 domain-containing protein n=1 Tax=Algibacillus agarilyticus TaxID=2234133 RepID=UPI000DCF7358|nr:DUF1289 domain-containing protein [Algibacillus agarilyticus]